MKKLLLTGLVLLSSGMIHAAAADDDSTGAWKAEFIEKLARIAREIESSNVGLSALSTDAAGLNFGSDEESSDEVRSAVVRHLYSIQIKLVGIVAELGDLQNGVESGADAARIRANIRK